MSLLKLFGIVFCLTLFSFFQTSNGIRKGFMRDIRNHAESLAAHFTPKCVEGCSKYLNCVQEESFKDDPKYCKDTFWTKNIVDDSCDCNRLAKSVKGEL